MPFRDYQQRCIDIAHNYIESTSTKKPVIVSPTGSGKSWIIAGIAEKFNDPIVVLQPSKELLKQNYEKYTLLGKKADICSASLDSRTIGHVTFATIGSILSSIQILKDNKLGLIIIDECHLGSAKGSQLERFTSSFPKCKIIGLTATPVLLAQGLQGAELRMITRAKKSFWNEMLHVVQIREIVEKGYWSKLKYEVIDSEETVLRRNSAGSEYTDDSLEEYYDMNEIEIKVIKKVQEIKDSVNKILVFVNSIDAAIKLSKKIPESSVIHSKMNAKERDEIVNSFKNGNIKIVINVLILSVGFDEPSLDVVIDTVPTMSVARYYQKIGRVTRPHHSKKISTIIDYSNNYLRFGSIESLTFEDDPSTKGWGMFSEDRILTNIPICGEPVYRKKKNKEEEYVFTFGKHNGKKLSEVPLNYLKWMVSDFTFRRNDPLEKTIKDYLNNPKI
jgi:DNA repair protein RadD